MPPPCRMQAECYWVIGGSDGPCKWGENRTRMRYLSIIFAAVKDLGNSETLQVGFDDSYTHRHHNCRQSNGTHAWGETHTNIEA